MSGHVCAVASRKKTDAAHQVLRRDILCTWGSSARNLAHTQSMLAHHKWGVCSVSGYAKPAVAVLGSMEGEASVDGHPCLPSNNVRLSSESYALVLYLYPDIG